MDLSFKSEKDKAAKGEDHGLRFSYVVPKVKWVSYPHCPYSYKANCSRVPKYFRPMFQGVTHSLTVLLAERTICISFTASF